MAMIWSFSPLAFSRSAIWSIFADPSPPNIMSAVGNFGSRPSASRSVDDPWSRFVITWVQNHAGNLKDTFRRMPERQCLLTGVIRSANYVMRTLLFSQKCGG